MIHTSLLTCRSFFCHCILSLMLAALATAAHAEEKELFPLELVKFKTHPSNPIFEALGEGHWETKIRERGWIMKDCDKYHMWYTGYDGTREGTKKLGYATSNDGLKWKRHPENPIYDKHWVEDMMVVKRGDTFYMFAEGRNDQAHLLTSKDAVHWNRQGRLDVRLKNGKPIEPGPFGTPAAWYEDGTWYLFYERRDLGIWLATSKDMKVWTNTQDEPVLSPGPGRYDKDLVAFNQVVKYKGRYYAYYHGSKRGTKLWTSNVATSTDLVHWTKYAGNPLFPLEENKSSNILVHDGVMSRMYTMHNQVHVHFPAKGE